MGRITSALAAIGAMAIVTTAPLLAASMAPGPKLEASTVAGTNQPLLLARMVVSAKPLE
jgi:hypothetical protein